MRSLPALTAAALAVGVAAPGLAGVNNQTAGFGTAVAVGDVNRDRIPDYIVGAPDGGQVSKGFSTNGQVLVYNGRNRSLITTLDGDTLSPGARDFGASVAAGDVNRDGYADIIVGDPNGFSGQVAGAQPQGDVPPGVVTVISGRNFEVLRRLTRNDFGQSFSEIDSVAAGDITGDGRADIVVGDEDGDANGEEGDSRGALSIFNGANFSLIEQVDGTDYTAGFNFGRSVAVADWNRDGRGDLIVLDRSTNEAGTVYVISGKNTRRVLQAFDTLVFGADFDSPNSVSAGLYDGDAYVDVVVGDPNAAFGRGRVGIVSSRTLRPLALLEGVHYDQSVEQFGYSVALVPHRSGQSSSTRGKVLVGDPVEQINNAQAKPQGRPSRTGTVYIIKKNSFLEGRLTGTDFLPV